jgi:hypothetical protein
VFISWKGKKKKYRCGNYGSERLALLSVGVVGTVEAKRCFKKFHVQKMAGGVKFVKANLREEVRG